MDSSSQFQQGRSFPGKMGIQHFHRGGQQQTLLPFQMRRRSEMRGPKPRQGERLKRDLRVREARYR